MSEFNGSIAQANVQFPIETVIEPIAGENYTRAVIFMHVDMAAENLPGAESPAAGQKIELDGDSYGSMTGGKLKNWLVPFFTSAAAAKLAVVLYDSDVTGENSEFTAAKAPLGTVYEAYKFYAYFKFILASEEQNQGEQVALAQLCLTDPLYSAHWVGLSDSAVLSKSSALVTALSNAKANSRVVYNPDTEINAALAQLGDTLGAANSTGTPVGNDVDMHAFGTIGASGSLDSDGNRLNLSATDKAALDEQKVGYQTWVGDGTENVVTEGSMTLKGDSAGANWVKAYIEYMCKIKTANYITRRNKFRNNSEYQSALVILSTIVQQFVDFGRLAQFAITAPSFTKLPASADSITVANAWQADYIDRIRSVTIYGTLYLTQPSK